MREFLSKCVGVSVLVRVRKYICVRVCIRTHMNMCLYADIILAVFLECGCKYSKKEA